MKPGGNGCWLPLETTEEDKEEKQKATASLAAATEISLDAAVEAVLLEAFSPQKKSKEQHRRLSSIKKMFLLRSWLALEFSWRVSSLKIRISPIYDSPPCWRLWCHFPHNHSGVPRTERLPPNPVQWKHIDHVLKWKNKTKKPQTWCGKFQF